MNYMMGMIKDKFLVITSIIFGILLFVFISGCTLNSKMEYIGKIIEINADNCKIKNEIDTHGGFLGDGDYFAKIICTEQEDSEIRSKWKELPLSEELQKVMDMKQCDNRGCLNVYEKYNIPNIENGFYYFFDRHSDAKNKTNDEELNVRSSYNFSVGIYDGNNKMIYYYELDT